ncbi:MAG: glycoside hydrolase family 1 protein [Alphaproteobacteria bacterium]|nr:glycoside hydrolase family 1 protein [Alphaproteobacteria bacterium]
MRVRWILAWGAMACAHAGHRVVVIPAHSGAFPEGFLWGAATAGFQVDMGCPTLPDAQCLDEASDWYQWVTDPRILGRADLHVTGEDVRRGPGMWELFEEDVARMEADGLRSLRLSLEWSRLFPRDASGATTPEALDALADPAAVARYHAHFAALRAAGLRPLVTVNHYTLPRWVHDGVACHPDPEACAASGWVDGERIVPLIAAYAGWVGREFGAEVDLWATLNEPFATALSGYVLPGEDRSAPPGRMLQGRATVAVLQHQIEGHAAMYRALHAADTVDADGDGDPAQVGIVLNMVDIEPENPVWAPDHEAVAHFDHLYHRLFLEGLAYGQWDADMDGTFDTFREDLAHTLDFLGINYYHRVVVRSIAPIAPLGPSAPAFDFFPVFAPEPHPEGLARVLARASEYALPLYVTENGTQVVERSEEVLLEHLAFLRAAMDAGADVRGYWYWSYVDNYEWNLGLKWRFGLYALDPVTKARTARPVLERYREVIADGGLHPRKHPRRVVEHGD